ncbi:hypothetical protein C8Q80DRAFT_608098 [Daedaleopsis nitida]|nr:hypothetical protein C8Q80DRAFT_608098 [Daedaleopsis nitida]
MRKISDLVEKDESQEVDMTSEYFNNILEQSVSSVAAEFSDLDGLTWEKPEARQALHEYHAQRAVRPRPDRGGLRTRGVHTRRSLSSLLSPTPSTQDSQGVSLSPNAKIAARNEETVRARRVSHDETVRARRSSHDETVRARPKSIAHSSDETVRVRPRAPSLPSASAAAALSSRKRSPPVARVDRAQALPAGRQLHPNEGVTPAETVRSTARIRARVSSTPTRTSAVTATPTSVPVPVPVPVNVSSRRPVSAAGSAASRPISLPPAPRANHPRVVLVNGKRPLSRERRNAPLDASTGLPVQDATGTPAPIRV